MIGLQLSLTWYKLHKYGYFEHYGILFIYMALAI